MGLICCRHALWAKYNPLTLFRLGYVMTTYSIILLIALSIGRSQSGWKSDDNIFGKFLELLNIDNSLSKQSVKSTFQKIWSVNFAFFKHFPSILGQGVSLADFGSVVLGSNLAGAKIFQALIFFLHLNKLINDKHFSSTRFILDADFFPANLGGLGICLASEIALPAYLSNVHALIGVTFLLLKHEIHCDKNLYL